MKENANSSKQHTTNEITNNKNLRFLCTDLNGEMQECKNVTNEITDLKYKKCKNARDVRIAGT